MKKPGRWYASIAVFLGLLCASSLAAQGSSGYPSKPGEVIIKFKRGAKTQERNAIVTDLGGSPIGRFPGRRGEHLRITKLSVDQAIARYRSHPKVEYIEPNYVYRIVATTPNDPDFSRLWGLQNTGQTGGLPGADIDAPLAWDVLTGSDVLVAITDTGIDWGHPDLAANVFSNAGEIPGNGLDDDHNGFIDDVRGWDFVNRDNDPIDDQGHGTHVSGTVGAIGNNGIGVAGVNWNVKIMPLKFLDGGGFGSTADAVSAIDYAVAMGARVISASWGGGGASAALQSSLESADSAGVLFVAAAGNSGLDNDVFPNYPSNYDVPNVIAVAASDAFDRLPFWSNFGRTTVDLAAPGENIYSTLPGGGYGYNSGTSMATPHVTGALALILGRFPGMSGADAKALLLSKVDTLSSLSGRVATGGRLNAFNTIAIPDSLPPGTISDLHAFEPNGTRVTLSWTATGDDGEVGTASRYEVRYSTAPIDEANFEAASLATGAPRPVAAGGTEQMRVGNLAFSTSYYFAVKAFDEFGNPSPISNLATATTLPPPDIAVTPGAVSADLLTGETATRTLTVTNTGTAELNLRVTIEAVAEAASVSSAPRILRTFTLPNPASSVVASVETPPAYPVKTTAYAQGTSGTRPAYAPESSRYDNIFSGSLRILLLHTGDMSEMRALLQGFPDIAVVDEFDGRTGAPTLSQLQGYNSVIVGANFPWTDPVAVGNVLADYVDSGGGVVLTLASFISGWVPQGRFLTEGYSPFPPGSGPLPGASLGTFDATHPIMAGVASASGNLLGDVSLAIGSELVASWTNGEPMVATKGSRVAAVNIFVAASGYWTGDIPLILHNAAFWSSGVTKWLSADPDTAVVPAGGSLGVVVTFDATSLDGGDYDNRVVFSSDDPDESELSVAAHLHVTGAPDIRVDGEPVMVESAVDYGIDGAQTSHHLLIAVPVVPGFGGSLELLADGDYGDTVERATAVAESTALGSVGNAGVDCLTARGSFSLSAALLSSLAADGVVNVTVNNTLDVNVFCPVNRHTVRLHYDVPADRLEFASIFTGQSRDLALTIRNIGSAPLELSSITSDRAEFTPGVSALTLAPRATHRLVVTFHPGSAGDFTGTLRLQSNDADQPLISIALSGTGLNPPAVGVQPSSLTSTLNEGGEETQTLRILNTGLSPLTFSLDVTPGLGGAGRVPFGGLSPPGVSSNNSPPRTSQVTHMPESREPRFRAAAAQMAARHASPQPLTCVVGDPSAGVIYAQSNQGTPFYRYRASSDTWEVLANAPISAGNNGGAALLNGRIYTTYAGISGGMGVYDIATNTWTTVPSPLGEGTANIASDGGQYLYLAVGSRMVRYDPATTSIADLTPAPFYFEPWGALKYLSGKLFGHQGNGSNALATYDVASNAWTLLPPMPGGAVAGAAIDPSAREYFAYGSYGGNNLYRYSIDSGTWSVSTISFFSVDDGGLAWLSGSQRGIYFAQGERGTGFVRFLDSSDFLTVTPTTGVVPPSGSMDVSARFVAGTLFGGTYQSSILVSSNDPVTSVLEVPATLTVIGAPNIQVEGDPTMLESVSSYEAPGARTTHRLLVTSPVPTSASGSLELIAEGDYGDASELATAIAESTTVGSVGSVGSDCLTATGSFPLSAGFLQLLAADGVVDVVVQNTPPVDVFCSANRHIVRLRYGGTTDRLDFAALFVGQSRQMTLTVRNNGSEALQVTSIASDNPVFTPSVSSMTLAPRTAQQVAVTFHPGSAGPFAGTLRFQSNDPDQALLSVAMSGIGLIPPDIAVSPPSLSASLFTGERTTQVLTIQNTGSSDLTFNVAVENLTANARAGQVREMTNVPVLAKGEVDLRRGEAVIASTGGPDRFGYEWKDSHSPGGPTFNWVEISSIGTPVPIWGDDWNSGPVPIGFSFPYYGNTFSNLRICSNGFISFTNDGAPFSHQPLPTPFAPENMLAAFWADLWTDPGSVYYYNDGSRMIVEYRNVRYLGGSTPFTFEILIYPNGRIVYQYLDMGGTQSIATIGFQNAVRDDGLTISFNAPYAQNQLAVAIASRPDWLSVLPVSGTIHAGEHLDLAVNVDAAGLEGGDYQNLIAINSNDPDESLVSVPVSLHVTGAPDILLSRNSFDFGEVFVGGARAETLVVSNLGTDLLTVSEVTASRTDYHADIAAFDLAPGASRAVMVTFQPEAAGLIPGTLTVRSNDPDHAEWVLSLTGTGLVPPDIAVTPASLTASLFTGGMATRTVTIQNTGESDLTWTVGTAGGTGGAAVGGHSTPAHPPATPPPDYQSVASAPIHQAGATVLVVEDVLPWFSAAVESLLMLNDIVYDVIPSSALGGT
ncbi:MAG TPA: S8 family serine peptidase, partial [Candidatus Eisenbacteria bacterium]|nr:S8 family serine peptidase [Candidatus Eisenbacteria bacterium]